MRANNLIILPVEEKKFAIPIRPVAVAVPKNYNLHNSELQKCLDGALIVP